MIKALLLTVLFLAYLMIRFFLGRHFERQRTPTDEDLLCALALNRGCSVYDVFMIAGKEWNYGEIRIGNDFDGYLRTTDIPLYVRHYLRNQPPSLQAACQHQPTLPFGAV